MLLQKLFGQGEERGESLSFIGFGDVIFELLRRCVGSSRILEAEKPGEADLLHQLERLLEVLLGLAREPDDDVRTQRETLAGRLELLGSRDVLVSIVTPDHPL